MKRKSRLTATHWRRFAAPGVDCAVGSPQAMLSLARMRHPHSQHVRGVSFLFAQNWLSAELNTKAKQKLTGFFAQYPLASAGSRERPPKVVFVVDLGAVHQLPSACLPLAAYRKSVQYFRAIVAEWLDGLMRHGVAHPRIEGFVYGSPPVTGLGRPSYTMAEGLRLDQLAKELLGEDMPAEQRQFPFPFKVIDSHHALLPRIDATMDGVHYGQTTRHAAVIALLNMLCGELL